MHFLANQIKYDETGFFSKLVTDYVAGNAALEPFYNHPVSVKGIKAAMAERKKYATDRKLITRVLQKQYSGISLTSKQQNNITKLADENTFTITTAHQPNIFTGHLYFIYKILHAIKLAAFLNDEINGSHFVPVFYMGSEDADLDELGEINLFGTSYKWQTKQTGAVGRMKVDEALIKLIESIAGAVTVLPHGQEIIALLKKYYVKDATIEQATFGLVNELFADYGLLIILPDNAGLKKAFIPVAEKELKERFSFKIVEETKQQLEKNYKIQAGGRELNLFYLKDDIRERIEYSSGKWTIVNSKQDFNESELIHELNNHPERFSPNVILRPVFQEMILPNVAFIGGGGELAYWLELKDLFNHLHVPFPVLILRNSFLIVDKKSELLAAKLTIGTNSLFETEHEIMNRLVTRQSTLQLELKKEKESLSALYQQIKKVSASVDTTLGEHTQALHVQALHKIEKLEKKMLRAEKKKMEAEKRQVFKLKSSLFPNNSLQERVDNIIPYYARYGNGIIDLLYTHSLPLQQQFTILTEKE